MCMTEKTYFTSESVTEGHPDKVADQIADALLDAGLEKDPGSRVAVEVMVTSNFVLMAGDHRQPQPLAGGPGPRLPFRNLGQRSQRVRPLKFGQAGLKSPKETYLRNKGVKSG